MGWIGQFFCLSNPEITWSLITYYDEIVATRLTLIITKIKYLLSYIKNLSVQQPELTADSLSAFTARQNDNGVELRHGLIRFPLIFAYFTSFLNFQEFVYHCLSCLTCFQISKFCFFCQIFWLDPRSGEVLKYWYHHKDKFKSNWAFYFLSILVLTNSKWSDIYLIFTVTQSQKMLFGWTPLLSCQNSIKSSLLSKFFCSLQASYLPLLVGRARAACVQVSDSASSSVSRHCCRGLVRGKVFAAQLGPSFCLRVSSGLIGSMKAPLSQLLGCLINLFYT